MEQDPSVEAIQPLPIYKRPKFDSPKAPKRMETEAEVNLKSESEAESESEEFGGFLGRGKKVPKNMTIKKEPYYSTRPYSDHHNCRWTYPTGIREYSDFIKW